jgi:hypothetical protein
MPWVVVAYPTAFQLRETDVPKDRRRLGATFGRLRRKGESTEVTFASLLRDHQPLFERGEPLGDHQKRHGGQ